MTSVYLRWDEQRTSTIRSATYLNWTVHAAKRPGLSGRSLSHEPRPKPTLASGSMIDTAVMRRTTPDQRGALGNSAEHSTLVRCIQSLLQDSHPEGHRCSRDRDPSETSIIHGQPDELQRQLHSLFGPRLCIAISWFVKRWRVGDDVEGRYSNRQVSRTALDAVDSGPAFQHYSECCVIC